MSLIAKSNPLAANDWASAGGSIEDINDSSAVKHSVDFQ
jgi:hypothetical protein